MLVRGWKGKAKRRMRVTGLETEKGKDRVVRGCKGKAKRRMRVTREKTSHTPTWVGGFGA